MAKKILVVEDDQAIRSALKDKLSREGFEVVESTNGEEGLRTATELQPDLILLDIVMPRVDGLLMLERLRKDEWGKDARVLVLSNLSNEEGVESAKQMGVKDYLVKTDWDINEVMQKVKQLLSD